MRYLFTTLAIGDSYLDSAISSYKDIKNITSKCDFNITTNACINNIDNINFDTFSLNKYEADLPGFSFYLSLKSLALKYAINKNYDYVIFTDADWKVTENFTEQKIIKLFEFMDINNYDFLFERPAEIGYYKNKPDECFFKEKLIDFNVYEHNLWDSAHCTNEQFLVFKVNWKYNLFVMKWEKFLWYSVANNIRCYPDGFDIGVSALESKMNWEFFEWMNIVRGCFEFKDKSGNTHRRF